MQYYIIGADGNEYGPVDAEQLRSWIELGRAQGNTLGRTDKESTWKALREFEEFRPHLTINTWSGITPLAPRPVGQPEPGPQHTWTYKSLREQLLARRANFSARSCLSRGWALMTSRFGLLLGATFVMALVLGVASIASFIVAGPLLGGLYWIYIRVLREEPAAFEDLFLGFSRSFMELFLAYLLIMLIAFATCLPGIILLLISVIMPILGGAEPWTVIPTLASFGMILLPMMVVTYLTYFAYPIIMEYNLSAWDSIKLSFVVTRRYLFTGLLVLFLAGLASASGALLFGIGIILTMCSGFSIMTVAYDDLFGNVEPE